MPKTTIKANCILREGKPTTRPLVLETMLNSTLSFSANIGFPAAFNKMADYTLPASTATAFALDTNIINTPGTTIVKITNAGTGTITAPTFTGLTRLGATTFSTTTSAVQVIEFIYDGSVLYYRINAATTT